MTILYNNEKGLYHKIDTKEDIEKIMRNNSVVDYSIVTIISRAPSDDIESLCNMVIFDIGAKLAIQWFPKNWSYEKIITFLIDKINREDIEVYWEKELKEDAIKHGLHSKNDFREPYIKLFTN